MVYLKTNSIIQNKKLYYILGVIFIIIIWIIASFIVNNSYIVPSFSSTIKALGKLFIDGYTYKVLGFTLLRLFVSVIVCLIIGVMLATFSSISEKFKYFITPLITLLKSLPIAVIIILILVILKTELAVYYIASVVILPIIYEATLNGYNSIDKDIQNEIEVISSSNLYIHFKVYMPIAMNHIITGLIQSIGLGLKVLVMAEYLSTPKYSIGNEIVFYKDIAVSMDYVYAWSIILICFVLVTDMVVKKVKNRVSIN